jgi:hypothetical protein
VPRGLCRAGTAGIAWRGLFLMGGDWVRRCFGLHEGGSARTRRGLALLRGVFRGGRAG